MTDTRQPTLEELDALGTVHSLVAPPEFKDMNGHVNVRHHYAMHMDANHFGFEQLLGLSESWIERTGQSSFSVEHHIKFHSEILIGDALSLHLRMLGRSDKAIHAMTILLDRTTGRVASTLELVELYVDLTTRRTTPMPEQLAKVLDDVIAQQADLAWDLPRAATLGTRR